MELKVYTQAVMIKREAIPYMNGLKITRKKLAIADNKGNTSMNLLHNFVLLTTMYNHHEHSCFSQTNLLLLVAFLLLSIRNAKITVI